MGRGQKLPANLAPRLVSREAAAAYVGVSPTTFDRLVKDSMMPRPKVLGARRKAWDVRVLDKFIDRLPVEGNDDDNDSWDNVDAA